MKTQKESNILNISDLDQKIYRIISITRFKELIKNRELVLVNPEKWDDENDNYSIKKYKDLKNIKTLLTLCFTTKKDVYHLWKINSS